jgi:hypothetical protein
LGFSGTEKITQYISALFDVNVSSIILEFTFNILIFVLFLSTLMHLLFQFDNKQKDAEKSIILLSSLLNEIENHQKNSDETNQSYVSIIAEKYEQLIHTLPSNSDKEFLKAKKDLRDKETYKEKINNTFAYLSDCSSLSEKELQKILIKIIQSDEYTKHIIDFVYDQSKDFYKDFYIGGGIIRNLVWDKQHHYKIRTPLDDIDIIYFDENNITKQADDAIEKKLKSILPNIDWSVRNQARMHTINNDEKYTDIVDAVSKWPETASAILIKKDRFGKYKIIAPHGLKDLFMLYVRPTPAFENKIQRVVERSQCKKWKEKWPNLRIDL